MADNWSTPPWERGSSQGRLTANTIALKVEGIDTPSNEEAKNWLLSVWNDYGPALIEGDYGGDKNDAVSSEADSAVPIYTYEVWMVWSGLKAWGFDSQFLFSRSESVTLGDEDMDMTKMAQIVLYEIAELLLFDYLEEHGVKR